MKLTTEKYTDQLNTWPQQGKHLLAQYDETSIVVYQAYRPAIGNFAAENQYFGGPFSLSRMSWIKPNFLWMMYRSGWGQKEGQEITLAVTLKREFFEKVLKNAIHSSFKDHLYESHEEWKISSKASSVQLQWDPDHHPSGAKEVRRAIQLGLRGNILEEYSKDALLEIEDISGFVAEQYEIISAKGYDELITPGERVYKAADAEVCRKLELSD
ncbi:MAG: DUF4291 domain-containing protein [bacterium]|nr:DUF4291 domain-containing protein [bacterium]